MQNDQTTDAKQRSVQVEITSKRWGSNPTPSVKIIEVPVIGESTVRLDITVDLRRTDTIEIRPIRREMDDVSGVVEDGVRLANS